MSYHHSILDYYHQFVPDHSNIKGARKIEIPTARHFIDKLEYHPLLTKIDLELLVMVQGDYNNHAAHCLRCYISCLITLSCLQLAQKYGERGAFKSKDIFPYALEDFIEVGKQVSSKLLAIKILSTFNPDNAKLPTWTKHLVRQHPSINQFLLEHNVDPWTDWGLLNGATRHNIIQLSLTPFVTEEAIALLNCFHAVYTRDRRKSGKNGQRCEQPRSEQLQEMCTISKISFPEDLLQKLVLLASQLRANIMPRREPKNILKGEVAAIAIEQKKAPNYNDDEDREMLQQEIEKATKAVIDLYYEKYSKNDKQQKEYLRALHCHLCEGLNQTNTAIRLGWSQATVSRKLQDFRTKICDLVLISLNSQNLFSVDICSDHNKFEEIKQYIDDFLDTHTVTDDLVQKVLSKAACKHLESKGIL
jgi:predicted transcriptional regulator